MEKKLEKRVIQELRNRFGIFKESSDDEILSATTGTVILSLVKLQIAFADIGNAVIDEFKKMLAKITALTLIITLLAMPTLADETLEIYDKNWNRTGFWKVDKRGDIQVYDKNWNRKGYIKKGAIYDEKWRKKGYVKRRNGDNDY